MSLKIDRLQLEIVINNDSARKSLRALNDEAIGIQKSMKGMVEGTDEWIQSTKRLSSIKTQMDTIQDSIGITGMSIKELAAKQKEFNLIVNNLPGNSPEYAKYKQTLDEINSRLVELRGKATLASDSLDAQSQSTKSVWDNMLAVAGGMGIYELASKGIEYLGKGIEYAKGIMESAGSTGDKWHETITGLTWGWDTFKKSLATGDFSNLISNMAYAIKMGEEYAKVLDRVRDRTTALKITESQEMVEFEKLKVIERSSALSKEERIAAGQQALAIEAKMLKEKMSISQESFNAEMSHATTITHLGEATIKKYYENYNAQLPLIDQSKKYLELKEKIASEELKVGNQGSVNQGAIENIKKYSEELNKIPAAAKAYSTVVAQMGKLDVKEGNTEVNKLRDAWVNLGETQQNSVRETSRIKITLSRLQKGELDEGEKAEKKSHDEVVKNENEAAKVSQKILEDKKRKAQEVFDQLVKASDEAGKQYAKILLEGDDQITKEASKNAEATYQFRLKEGIATADEILAHEMGNVIKSKEFAESSATEQAQIIANAYQKALTASGKGAPIPSTTVAGENPDQTFQPAFTPGSTGTPADVPGLDNTDLFNNKLKQVTDYAKQVKDVFSDLDGFMSKMENDQINRDEANNNEKKAKLKLQLDSKIISQKQYDSQVLKMDNDLDAKKRKLAHDQAVRAKQLSLFNAMINVAEAVSKALTGGPLIGIILAAVTAAMGVVEIGYILSTPVPAAATGRYNVIGNQDGKVYNNVPYQDTFNGIPGRPMLVNETGNEIVIDPYTTRNLQMNYPNIIEGINQARVPQRASGSYPESFKTNAPTQIIVNSDNSDLKTALDLLNFNLKNGIRSSIVYDDLEKANQTVSKIRTDSTR